jgi:hypothetical protein
MVVARAWLLDAAVVTPAVVEGISSSLDLNLATPITTIIITRARSPTFNAAVRAMVAASLGTSKAIGDNQTTSNSLRKIVKPKTWVTST